MYTLNTKYTPNEQDLIWEESLAVARHALYIAKTSESPDELKQDLIEIIADYIKGSAQSCIQS